MNKQLAMIRKLQQQGVDTSEPIPRDEWNKARVAVRTPKELVTDGARVTRAFTEYKIGLKQVSDEQAEENLEICRTNKCGSYDVLANGDEACWRCTCAGKAALKVKVWSRRELCPAGLWDNR